MRLTLSVLEGPTKGAKVLAKPGLIIGRNASGLALKDPRSSSQHAKIEIDTDGSLVLVDQGSTNGIKLKNERVDRLILKDGVTFRIGGSLIAVEEEAAPPQQKEITHEKVSLRAELPAWKRTLIEFLSESPLKNQEPGGAIGAFHPALVLEFIEGYQLGTVWTLGYGPRKIGRISPDLAVFDESAPDTCFEVSPSRQGIQFKTEFPHKVFLNGESITSEVLREGDTIKIFNTTLKVRFI